MKHITINGQDLIIHPDGLIQDKATNEPLKYHLTGGNSDSHKRYLRSTINHKPYYHHRIIAEALFGKFESNLVVDHINGDTQDNRFSNLRLISHSGNSLNRQTKAKVNSYTDNLKALAKELNILGLSTIAISKSLNTGYRTTWRWTKQEIEPQLLVRDEGTFISFNINGWSGRFIYWGLDVPCLFILFKDEEIVKVEDLQDTFDPEARVLGYAKIFANKLIVNGFA